MKLRKLVACLGAASVMVGALASTADAMLVFPPAEQMHSGASTAGNWLVQPAIPSTASLQQITELM